MWRAFCITFLCLSAALVAAQTDECDHDYYYVNAGDSYAGGAGDISVSIACIDADGCDSIIYVQAGCNGCFDPTCTNGVSRKEITGTGLGGVVTVDGAVDFTSGGISDGDLICSTGQLSVASRNSATVLTQAHEWNRGSMAGTEFAYMNFRGNVARCFIYSFEGSTVTVTSSGVAGTPFSVGAFAFSLQTNLDAVTLPVIITSSDNPILVTCYEGTSDYTNIPPLTSGAYYGYDSRNTLGVSLDCTTLASTLSISQPSCADVEQNTVTVTPDGVNEAYTISGDRQSDYLGRAFRCVPPAGSCLWIYTHADSDGNEGAHLTPEVYKSSFFVLPLESRRFAITSIGSSPVSCNFLDTDGVTVLQASTTAGTSTLVKDDYIAATFSAGVRISCGGDVIITASFNEEEYSLNGREVASLWSYSAGISTCSPTSVPTSSPSSAPTTLSPTQSPSTSPTTPEPTDSPSREPTTLTPTSAPSNSPTSSPTQLPSFSPTTSIPTSSPSSSPTTPEPTDSPTVQPSDSPTQLPSASPTTSAPSSSPSAAPTGSPSTPAPTDTGATSNPTASPSTPSPSQSPTTPVPSESPTTSAPSESPTTSSPSISPSTSEPTVPTDTPTAAPFVPTPAPDGPDLGLVASLSAVGAVCAAALGSLLFVVYRRRKRQREMEYEELLKREKELRSSEFSVDMEAML